MTSTNLATIVCLFVCLLSHLADSNPYNNQRYSGHSFSSRSGSDGNGIAYSGSSYHTLGIQATAQQQPQQSRGNEQYWWQGSQSPFSEGAAQNRGVSSGARAIDTSRAHARPLVPGCGGGKCFGASSHSAVASSSKGGQQYLPPSASSSSVQGSHYTQNFGGAASQGQSSNVQPFPGCAAAMKCVTEEFCSVDGVMVNTPVRLSPYEKEHLRVPLMECTNPETNQVGFCCRDPLYEDPWPANMPMPGMTKLPTQPGGASLNRPVISASAAASNNGRPQVSSFNNGQQNGNRPTVTTTAAVSTGSNGRPVSVGAAASSFNQASPAQHGQLSQNYGPPSGASSTRPFNQQPAAPAQAQRPANGYQSASPNYQAAQSQQQTNTLQGPPAPPFPGCAAAMKCVTEDFCSVDGVMVNAPVRLSPYEKEYLRVPLMECTNPETNQVGFCCRDPLYEDPWPANMPMPGMTKLPTQQGGASLNRPVVSASAATVSSNGRPSGLPFNNGHQNGNQPTATATTAVSSSSNGRPGVAQGVAASFNQQGQQQFFSPTSPGPTPRPQVAATSYQQPSQSYQQPSQSYQQPSQSYLPPTANKPTQPQHTASGFRPYRPASQQAASSNQPTYQSSQSQTNTAHTLQGPPASTQSFPGCAAAMKCVTEEFCSASGVMINTPVRLSPYEKEYLRVPLMACLNTATNQEGFCCRDPLYNDPWPAGMPMP